MAAAWLAQMLFGTLTDRRQYTQAIKPIGQDQPLFTLNQEPREEAVERGERQSQAITGTRYALDRRYDRRKGVRGSHSPTMIDLAPLLLGRASFVGRYRCRLMMAELQRVLDLGPVAPGGVVPIAMLHSII